MVQTLPVDQLDYSKRLIKAGASKALAEEIARGAHLVDVSHLATKADLLITEKALREEIADAKIEMARGINKILFAMLAIAGAFLALSFRSIIGL